MGWSLTLILLAYPHRQTIHGYRIPLLLPGLRIALWVRASSCQLCRQVLASPKGARMAPVAQQCRILATLDVGRICQSRQQPQNHSRRHHILQQAWLINSMTTAPRRHGRDAVIEGSLHPKRRKMQEKFERSAPVSCAWWKRGRWLCSQIREIVSWLTDYQCDEETVCGACRETALAKNLAATHICMRGGILVFRQGISGTFWKYPQHSASMFWLFTTRLIWYQWQARTTAKDTLWLLAYNYNWWPCGIQRYRELLSCVFPKKGTTYSPGSRIWDLRHGQQQGVVKRFYEVSCYVLRNRWEHIAHCITTRRVGKKSHVRIFRSYGLSTIRYGQVPLRILEYQPISTICQPILSLTPRKVKRLIRI